MQTSIAEGFEKTYGIPVEIIGLNPGQLLESVRMESQTGAVAADFVFSGITVPISVKAMGAAQPVGVTLPEAEAEGVWRVHPYDLDSDKVVIVLYRDFSPNLLINTNLVKPGEEPQSWFDLLEPKWKGQIAIRDPRLPGPGSEGLTGAMDLGEDYWRKMAQQDVVLVPSSGRHIDMIALGEIALDVFPSHTRGEAAMNAGAPLRFIHLKEGSSITTKGPAILKDAPHPNAALVFLNWLMSREGQIAISKPQGRITIRTDIEEDWINIPEFRPGAAHKAFSRYESTEELFNEVREFATRIFGELK